jgi:hypothetical protein
MTLCMVKCTYWCLLYAFPFPSPFPPSPVLLERPGGSSRDAPGVTVAVDLARLAPGVSGVSGVLMLRNPLSAPRNPRLSLGILAALWSGKRCGVLLCGRSSGWYKVVAAATL